MSTDTESAIILQALPGIGATGLSKLLNRFGSFKAILKAAPAKLPKAYQSALRQYRAQPNEHQAIAQQTIADCKNDGITILTIQDKDYPSLLKEIDHPPAILYVKGDIHLLALPQIAIVGSRQHTVGGEHNALAFAQNLSANGFTITSGMALGIDAAAHRGAMHQGKTIAVLGTGIDIIYPRRHVGLYDDIINHGGAVVSEFAPGTPARPGNFPQRNRIISGLSLGVLIVEAAIQSGSLITARLAMEQGREVFAIPGSIHNPVSKGCHRLIREGATLVETAEDIVTELGGMLSFVSEDAGNLSSQTNMAESLEPREAKLLDEMGYDAIDLDSLLSRCGLSVSELTASLTQLELHGLISHSSGMYSRII